MSHQHHFQLKIDNVFKRSNSGSWLKSIVVGGNETSTRKLPAEFVFLQEEHDLGVACVTVTTTWFRQSAAQ
jgi:hypothetical protein